MEILFLIRAFYGLLLLFLGFAISHFSLAEVFSGYDPEKVMDREGLAKWVGGNLMLMGGLICLYVFLNMAGIRFGIMPVFIDMLIIFGLIARISAGSRRFEKR